MIKLLRTCNMTGKYDQFVKTILEDISPFVGPLVPRCFRLLVMAALSFTFPSLHIPTPRAHSPLWYTCPLLLWYTHPALWYIHPWYTYPLSSIPLPLWYTHPQYTCPWYTSFGVSPGHKRPHPLEET